MTVPFITYLGCDEHVLTFDTTFGHFGFQSGTDKVFITVDCGGVDVAITGVQGS